MSLSTRNNVPDVDITINNNPLKVDDNVKYLGIQVSNNISWSKQISNVCKKLSHGFQMLRRLKSIIPVNDMITIYIT